MRAMSAAVMLLAMGSVAMAEGASSEACRGMAWMMATLMRDEPRFETSEEYCGMQVQEVVRMVALQRHLLSMRKQIDKLGCTGFPYQSSLPTVNRSPGANSRRETSLGYEPSSMP